MTTSHWTATLLTGEGAGPARPSAVDAQDCPRMRSGSVCWAAPNNGGPGRPVARGRAAPNTTPVADLAGGGARALSACDAGAMIRASQPSLPAGWERVARRIRRLFGHEVHLELVEEATAFTEAGDFLLYIDGELAGSVRPSWTDEWAPDEILANLSEQIEEYWAQDLGGGLWGPGLPPPVGGRLGLNTGRSLRRSPASTGRTYCPVRARVARRCRCPRTTLPVGGAHYRWPRAN